MHDEMVAYLRGIYTPGLVDLESFQISAEIAIYWFAADFHGGQSHPLYSVLSTSHYHPGYMEHNINHSGDDLAIDMYDSLRAVFNV